jgi:hypothetical protein
MLPDITELSLVFLGNFNPAIFHPSWLELKKLLTEDELKYTKTEIINPHLSKFRVAWAEFVVTDNRFQLNCTDGTSFESLRDLALGIFAILEETPLTAFGFNNIHHYKLNPEQYIEFGNILAPFNNWNDILVNPKVLNLEMIQENREDEYKGSKRIRISNDHFDLTDFKEMGKKLKVISDNWDSTFNYTNHVTESLLKKGKVWK